MSATSKRDHGPALVEWLGLGRYLARVHTDPNPAFHPSVPDCIAIAVVGECMVRESVKQVARASGC